VWQSDDGRLAPWVRLVVALACLVTAGLVAVVTQSLWDLGLVAPHASWVRWFPPLVVAAALLLAFVPPWRLSRFARLAVVLPGLHLVMFLGAYVIWLVVAPDFPRLTEANPLPRQLPLGIAIAGIAVACAGGALVAVRRRREWAQGFSMLALSYLLLLGLWLPIACAAGTKADHTASYALPLLLPPKVLLRVMLPPFLVGFAFTILAMRWPAQVTLARRAVIVAIGTLLLAAVGTRAPVSFRAAQMYVNFVHILAAAAIVAIGAIATLAAMTVARAWPGTEREGAIRGVIGSDAPEAIALYEVTSWLRAPELVQRPFVVETASGAIPLSGCRIVAPMPRMLTRLPVGTSAAVLGPGDRVALVGLSRTAGAGGPFRTGVVETSSEVIVRPATYVPQRFADLALAIWRPCVAYLLIATAVALPAMASLLTDPADWEHDRHSDSIDQRLEMRVVRDQIRQ
jgi:hypothetical protein